MRTNADDLTHNENRRDFIKFASSAALSATPWVTGCKTKLPTEFPTYLQGGLLQPLRSIAPLQSDAHRQLMKCSCQLTIALNNVIVDLNK